MSYDILLYPRTPGQDWATILQADEAETPEHILGDEALLETGVATFRRISARAQRFLNGEVETWVAEETGGDVLGELTETDSGLAVELFHGSGSVSFPYREREDSETFHDTVRDVVRVVAEETGYEAYDPQRADTFDGTIDDQPGLAALREAGAAETADDEAGTPPTGADDATGQESPAAGRRALQPRTPEQVQRRAVIDLVLGVALIAYGLLRRSEGETGILTTILLVLGAMNLFGGILSAFAAKRLRERAAGEAAGQSSDPGAPSV